MYDLSLNSVYCPTMSRVKNGRPFLVGFIRLELLIKAQRDRHLGVFRKPGPVTPVIVIGEGVIPYIA